MGHRLDDRAALAVHGWVAFVEECVIRWNDDGRVVAGRRWSSCWPRRCVTLVLAASDEEVGDLVSMLTSDAAIGAR